MEDAPAGTSPARGPKTRGRGFVEFTEHEHALCALRQLNNNPQPFGKAVTSIVSMYGCLALQILKGILDTLQIDMHV
jgi:hypothetical protein